MRGTAAAVAAIALATSGLAAAAGGAAARPAITTGGLGTRAATMSRIYGAQRRNNAVLNHVQSNIRASQRARYRAQ